MLCCIEEARRYKKCGSHDGQSWYSNYKRICFVHDPKQQWKGYFCNSLRKNWPASTSSPLWPTTNHGIRPPFLSPPLKFQKKFPTLTCPVWNPCPLPFLKKRRGRKLCQWFGSGVKSSRWYPNLVLTVILFGISFTYICIWRIIS